MEALPKIVRQRLRSGAKPGVHPQADLLSAFAEKTLTERERTRVMEHLSRCEDCREVMFLSAPQQEPVQIVGKIPSSAGWLSWPALRWGAAVACVVVVGTAITLRQQSLGRQALSDKALSEKKTESIASYIAPAPAAATSPNHSSSAELRYKAAQPNKDAGEDKLAKLEPPARPQPRAMTATPQFQMQLDQPQQSNGIVAGGSAGAAVGSGAARPASDMAMAPAPARDMLAKGANPQAPAESDQKQAPAAASRETVNVKAQSEMVEVEANPSPVVGHTNETVTVTAASPAELPLNGRNVTDLQTMASPAPAANAMKSDSASSEKKVLARAYANQAPRWMLNPEGMLERSWDVGKTWETIPVADKTSFLAFAPVGAEIWVGGANGVLYHSSDAGLHWVKVVPKVNDEVLTSDIIHIEFSDSQNGKITTASGEIWTTSDAGQTWQKN